MNKYLGNVHNKKVKNFKMLKNIKTSQRHTPRVRFSLK